MPTFRRPPSHLLPFFTLTLAMLLWASSFIALKLAFRSYDPMVVIFGRMAVASLCFMLIGRKIYGRPNPKPGDLGRILFMAFCEPCLYFIFEAKALENTTASQAGVITAMLPVMVMIGAMFILKEKISPKGWLGALVAVVGVCWLTLAGSPSNDAPNPVLGNFLEFLAMVCAVGYTISIKDLTSRYSPFFLTAVQAFIGCLFYLPLLFLPSTELPRSFDSGGIAAIAYLGGVITLGAYGLYNYSLKHVPANRAANFVNLIPVFSVFLGWLILGETFTSQQLLAAGLIMAGVIYGQSGQATS